MEMMGSGVSACMFISNKQFRKLVDQDLWIGFNFKGNNRPHVLQAFIHNVFADI